MAAVMSNHQPFVQKLTSRLHRGSNASHASSGSKDDLALRDNEKRRLCEWDAEKRPMDYDQICVDPEKKPVGHSSKVLRYEDFDLIKTLGTGTFARVWLVRFANASAEDKDRVFALKKLRKVDGGSCL